MNWKHVDLQPQNKIQNQLDKPEWISCDNLLNFKST